MMNNRLNFYLVNSRYCDYLREYDKCVPYTMDKKSSRPFVGILLKVNGISYYAPLSSPKPKHLRMKNQVDLLKINNGLYGVINFNNMIPIHKNSVKLIELTATSTDTPEDIKYKTLLSNQLTWCNANKEKILLTAHKLYNMVVSGRTFPSLNSRCCKFAADEQLLKRYCIKNGWTIEDDE